MANPLMSFRFHRRMKLMKGVTLNLSKHGASVSLGGKVGPIRAKLTTSIAGKPQQRQTVGLPGTGLSYTGTSKK